jgi:hypothetical protein
MPNVGRSERRPIYVTIGFAASDRGDGVAYARIENGTDPEILRIAFRCRPQPALRDRDVAYAALNATAKHVRERGLHRVVFATSDAQLARDIEEHLSVPPALAMPYVTLRCTLNRFAAASVVTADDETVRDLTARARAEASLHVAA